MTFETLPVVHLDEGRFPEYPNDEPERVLTNLARRFGRVVLVDVAGIRENDADLEFLQQAARRRAVWVDAGSRYATDAMDLFVAGAEAVTMRWNTLQAPEELKEAAELCDPGTLFLGLEYPHGQFLANPRDKRSAEDAVRFAESIGVGVVYLLADAGEDLARFAPRRRDAPLHPRRDPADDRAVHGLPGRDAPPHAPPRPRRTCGLVGAESPRRRPPLSDLARTIAFAFRRKGAASLPGADLRMLLAYDLRWFAPEDAKRVVQRAVENGLLRDEGGVVSPTFDVAAVEIPVNFRPTTLVLDEAPSALPPVQERVHVGVQAPPSPLVERAADDERRKRGLLMGAEVARLVVRRRAGEDVKAEATAREAAVLSAAADRSRA